MGPWPWRGRHVATVYTRQKRSTDRKLPFHVVLAVLFRVERRGQRIGKLKSSLGAASLVVEQLGQCQCGPFHVAAALL